MRIGCLKLLLVIICANCYLSGISQQTKKKAGSLESQLDSLKKNGAIFNFNPLKPEIALTTTEAINFLQKRVNSQYWNNADDPLRLAFGRLIYEATNPPYDSVASLLKSYPYDSLSIPWDKFYIWEPIRLKIPVSPSPQFASYPDSVAKSDTTIMVVIDTLNEVISSHQDFPFRYMSFPYQFDSIRVAVGSLMNYLEERDSSIINFTGSGDAVTSVWLNSKPEVMQRFWLKNESSDSVTVWIATLSKDTIGLYLEQGINFRRPVRQTNYSYAKIEVQSIDNFKLLDLQRIIVKHQYWKYHTESSLILNQAMLMNWVKGGESNIATAMDITSYADYKNKDLKLSSNNFVRLKLGFQRSGENDLRKNIDLLETNLKLNHKAFGKFDFSGILLFKTQVAPGFTYTKDSNDEEIKTEVSKFMNPAILTIGFGLDYKPNKTTSINFSPLSYKGTFVPDTAIIDQTKYGIKPDKRSKNEPGVSFMITNDFKPFKKLTITNRLQLFTNYINNPQNVDVDWEMILVANLNWFTDVRFNTHLIFDDDTKTVELDKEKQPVLRPDGTQKKTARTQFKEMIGFSFVFRF